MLDADTGTLQWLHRKAACVAGQSAMSTGAACWHWQTHRYQDQISGFQVHEDQQVARARLAVSS